LQLIPRSILSEDFPRHFVDEYIHWLDLNTHELEFRPAGSPWTSGPSNWRLYIQEHGTRPCVMLQTPSQDISWIRLIDIRSSTFGVVSDLLSPLESPKHIVATLTPNALEVSLPRLRLSFFVNASWELECRTIPGYVVDKNQSCGTMFGLKNKLVLCSSCTCSEEPLPPRRVIIPQGEVSFKKNGDFTKVSIDTAADQHVCWNEYTIDPELGCLRCHTTLGSKLYRCYLHALTSHCLPDPLLGHTGTEEALYILQSATCRSFQRLDLHESKLLHLISKLSPKIHHKVGSGPATVKWKDLSALSQHSDFFFAVSAILDRASALESLYDSPADFMISLRDKRLLNREARRNKSYYTSALNISGQTSLSTGDIEYRSRDVSDRGSAEPAFRTSWSIWNAQPFLPDLSSDLWDLMTSWNSIGPALSEITLQYNPYWLDFDAARDWIMVYDLCRNSAKQNRRNLQISLTFSLSAAAYNNYKHSNTIAFLVIFALDERCHDLSPPQHLSYNLSDGLTPGLTRLENIIYASAVPPKGGRSSAQNTEYEAALSRESSEIANLILSQWPDYRLVDFRKQWLDKSECNRRVNRYSLSISWNNRLREHVLQLQTLLQDYEDVSIPAAVPYTFSPQFITSNPASPSYWPYHIFLSRTNVPLLSPERMPFQDHTIPPTEPTEPVPPLADSKGLEIILNELHHSHQPSLQLYGRELNNSYREVLGRDASQSTRGPVPSHEVLVLYHNECSHRKDKLFSEISAALSPSQLVEETCNLAGLWPWITPRLILRQLAHDRINRLPDQWKSVIMRYAISFIKYQQSLRLLEHSSRQEHEELLREIEAIRHETLADSTPDWLLIQVCAILS
jgi:hypothetical protein